MIPFDSEHALQSSRLTQSEGSNLDDCGESQQLRRTRGRHKGSSNAVQSAGIESGSSNRVDGSAVRMATRRQPRPRLRDQMPPFDWTPTLDASAIAFAPPEQLGRPLTIGRHARDGSEKWPKHREDLLAAYPDCESLKVLILGGAAEPSSTLGGQLPSNWTVIPFGQMRPTDYLRQLDVFVYFPHPDLNEAFGRTILEAMFAGVPCVLPPRFRETFGDLALFCEPTDVHGVLSRLAADDTGRLRFVRWVRSQVDDYFETTALLRRIPEFGLVDQRVVMSIGCPPDIAAFRLRVAPTPQFQHDRADAA